MTEKCCFPLSVMSHLKKNNKKNAVVLHIMLDRRESVALTLITLSSSVEIPTRKYQHGFLFYVLIRNFIKSPHPTPVALIASGPFAADSIIFYGPQLDIGLNVNAAPQCLSFASLHFSRKEANWLSKP